MKLTMQINWDNWKCSATGLHQIMSKGRNKSPFDMYNEAKAEHFKKSEKIALTIEKIAKKEAEKEATKNKETQMFQKLFSMIEKLKEERNTLTNEIGLLQIQIDELEERKDEVSLSDGAKSFLRRQFLKIKYGRFEKIKADSTEKGNYCEEDAISMLSDLDMQLYLKETDYAPNHDFLKGICDILTDDDVKDTKCSKTMLTFMECEFSENYWWQLWAYCEMYGRSKAQLCYCLCNTPQHILEKQERFLGFQYEGEELEKEIAQLHKNNNFDDLTTEEKVKRFDFVFDELLRESVFRQIKAAREYLKTCKL